MENIDTNNDGRSDINNYHILDNLDPNKDYDVKVVFDEVGVQKYGLIPRVMNDQFEFIKGNWEFNFTVNGKKIMGETKVFDINKEISIDDEDFKALINIEQLRVSPISVKLSYTVNGKKIMGETKVFDINKEISIDDEDFKALINIEQLRVSPISVKLSYTSKMGEGYSFENRDIEIELLDQNGKSINCGGSGRYNEDETYMLNVLEGNLEDNQELFENRDIEIELLDQNGKSINCGGSGRYNEDETYMLNVLEGNLEDNQELKSIKILPYQYYREKNSDNLKYHHRIEYEDKAIIIDLDK